MSPDEASDAYPLAQVDLIVSELERSRRFYSRLGWRFRTMGDQALMAEVPGGLLVALHLPDYTRTWNSGYDGATGGSVVLDVDVPDHRETVDRLHAELVGDGHQSPQPPFDAFFGSRYAIVRDPDGNLVGLKRRSTPGSGSRRTATSSWAGESRRTWSSCRRRCRTWRDRTT